MSAPTPAGAPRSTGLRLSAFGQPSPALLARADRGYARFLTDPTPDADTGAHDQDDDTAGTR